MISPDSHKELGVHVTPQTNAVSQQSLKYSSFFYIRFFNTKIECCINKYSFISM